MCAYAERELASGTPLAAITRHMFGLYAGQPGARAYRQRLSEGARTPGAGSASCGRPASGRPERLGAPPPQSLAVLPNPGQRRAFSAIDHGLIARDDVVTGLCSRILYTRVGLSLM